MQTLTTEKRHKIAEAARIELASRRFEDYVEYVHHGAYQHFDHTRYLCDRLQPIAEGESRKIIIEMPPRHSKSMTVTETFPSYFIGKNPDKHVIATAYGDDLARKFGRRNREKLDEYGKPIFGISLSHDNAAVNNWGIEGKRGGMLSTGIGGSITGEGADLLIVDDPIKNIEEASSPTIRQKIWDEWQGTLQTRLQDGASVIVIMTRWHNDDLVGRLLYGETADDWEIIRMPAIAEDDDDLMGRERGQALCPELGFDEKWAKKKEKSVGSLVWAALYQQRPSPEGGGIFKRSYFRYFQEKGDVFLLHADDGETKRIPQDRCRWFQTADTAMKANQKNDYTVIGTWILTPENELLLYNVHRDRVEVPDQWPLIKRQKQRFPSVLYQAVEDKGSGTGLIQKARREGMPLRILKAETDKVTRSFDISVMYENGMVYHLMDTPWLSEYERELLLFPNGEHDDQVDVASYAGKEVNGNHIGIRVIGDDDDLDDELDDMDDEDFDGWNFEQDGDD